jgi:hypothetical protein
VRRERIMRLRPAQEFERYIGTPEEQERNDARLLELIRSVRGLLMLCRLRMM